MPDRPPVYRHPAAQSRGERNAEYFARRGSSPQRGYDRPWRRCRAAFLAKNPLCHRCLSERRFTPATEVHHVEPVMVAPHRRLDWSNLMSLCHPCHMVIEAEGR